MFRFICNNIKSHSNTFKKINVNCLHSIPVYSNSLVEKHGEFLNLVENHGDGNILGETCTLNEHVLIVTISNIKNKNAISGRMMKQLAILVDSIVDNEIQTINSISNTKDIPFQTPFYKALILQGDGDMFCSGADFKLSKEIVTDSHRGMLMQRFMSDALNRLRSCKLISVCLINGPAVGGGSEITTACDFRIMLDVVKDHQRQSFAQFIHCRMGVTPGWGGLNRLLSIVGRKHAITLLGTSVRLTPSLKATTMGFVDGIITNNRELIENPFLNSLIPVYDIATFDVNTLATSDTDEYISHVVAYLKPYLQQPFPHALATTKTVISQISEDIPSEINDKLECDTFRSRWGGTDNQSALKSK